ncbi:MAG: hypothetical protein KGL39_21700 [Patescibacteria group bacterium]|nr:hypothetical protein [Patescibacteria group bacterium]
MTEIIYRLREELEDMDQTQSGGLNSVLSIALLAAGNVKIYTRINALGEYYIIRPRVDLKVDIGQATGRRIALPNQQLRFDAFHFHVGIQIVTNPRNIPAENLLHEQMISICRQTLGGIGGNESYNDMVNFPNVFIAEVLKDTGVSDSVIDKDEGLEHTTFGYEGIVCIRPAAWN